MDEKYRGYEEVLAYARRRQNPVPPVTLANELLPTIPGEELRSIIRYGINNSSSVDWRKLEQHTQRIELHTIVKNEKLRKSIRYLYCFDDEEIALNGVLTNSAERFYIGGNNSWLLVWGTTYENMAFIISLCKKRLLLLDIRCRRLNYLNLSFLENIRHLHVESLSFRNTFLIDVEGLESLDRLETLSLTHAWAKETLDLSNMTNLRELHISQNMVLSRLTGLPQLRNLELLRIDHSAIGEMLDLSGAGNLAAVSLKRMKNLTSLNGLAQAKHMEGFVLYDTALQGILDLSGLTNLETLTIGESKQLTEIRGLSGLGKIRSLNLSGLMIGSEIDLTGMLSLSRVDIVNNPNISEIKGIKGLDNLHSLDISKTGVKRLPTGIRGKHLEILGLCDLTLDELPEWLPEFGLDFGTHRKYIPKGIKLHHTTVKDVDMSIFEQPYEVVAEWFKNHSQGSTRTLNEIKVVFLGDGEAGKSHTIARLMNDGGEPKGYTDQSTPGIVIKNRDYDLDGRKFQVHYWDFGGQEIMHSMHRIFLTNRTMYVVLLNARDDTQGDRAHYWLQNIQSFAPNAPVLLVLNKIDQNPKASVDETTLRARYPGLKAVVRMSAKEFSREDFNREFTRVLLQEIGDTGYLDAQWPQSWIAVKKHLEEMETHYILGSAYRKLCQDCQVGNVQTELLHWFNDLGVSFCFCDKEDYTLNKHVILRPDWITNALYIMLFNDCPGTKNGQLPRRSIYALLERVHEDKTIKCTLPGARYDTPGDIEYVLGVMRKFQLSLDAGEDMEFIPMLCQQDSTVDIHYYEKDAETLEFRMEFEYLPDNLLHRLMVERHAELDMDKVWRKGAKFHLSELGLTAVVVIDGGVLRFFIQHTDPMHRPNTYLAMLKANVDRIVEKMGIKAPECKLVYKVHGNRAVFGYDRLLKLHARGRKEEYCEALDEDFLIDDILNQSAPAASEDLNTLLEGMISACLHLQGNPNYRGWNENGRNCVVRDSLGDKGYIVLDQTLRGTSASGKSYGELDLLIQRVANRPWVLCEALIAEGYTQKWNEHLDKLLKEYNPHGLSTLFLLTYVDCEKTKFDDIWQKYHQHILTDAPKGFILKPDSVSLDLNNSYEHIKIARCNYLRGSYAPHVYHIFLQMDPK